MIIAFSKLMKKYVYINVSGAANGHVCRFYIQIYIYSSRKHVQSQAVIIHC